MEACREGIEDYEYMAMLRDAIQRSRDAAATPAAVADAEQLLEHAPRRVFEGTSPAILSWHHPLDRSIADQIRVEVLDALSVLP